MRSNLKLPRRKHAISVLALAACSVQFSPHFQRQARGLTIDLTYASSVTGLSNASQVEAATNYAAQQLDALFTDPVAVNINVTCDSSTSYLADASAAYTNATYTAIRTVLNSTATDPIQTMAAASLPASDPTGGTPFFVPQAEAKAMGFIAGGATGSDGTFSFSTVWPYTFISSARAVPNEYDFIGVAEHELSHLLGRTAGLDYYVGGDTPFDLFRFSSPGVRNFSPSYTTNYFSINGGNTDIRKFANSGDLGDWDMAVSGGADYQSPDACNSAQYLDSEQPFTPVDIEAMDALGLHPALNRALTWDGSTNSITDSHWLNGGALTATYLGTALTINGGEAFYEPFQPDVPTMTLSSSSIFGQSLTVTGGTFFLLNDMSTGVSHPLAISSGGSLTVSGSTANFYVDGPLSVGDAAGGSATASFSAGFVDVGNATPPDPSMYVGNYGTGTVNESGSASVYLWSNLNIGAHAGSSGTYNLISGTLTVAGNLALGGTISGSSIAAGGTAQLYIGGGSLSAAELLSTAGGNYSQSGGSVSLASADFSKAASFAFSGGTLTINGGTFNPLPQSLSVNWGLNSVSYGSGVLVSSTTGSPSLVLQSASVANSSAYGLLIGNSGGAGNVTMSGALTQFNGFVMVGAGGSGSYASFVPGKGQLSVNGGANLQFSGSFNVGMVGGQGMATIDGVGTSVTAPLVQVGYNFYSPSAFSAPGTGTLSLTNGAALSTSSLAIGVYGGQGTVTVDGGSSVQCTGELDVGGNLSSGTGSLNLTNGAAVQSAVANIGDYGVGNVTVIGSTWNNSGTLGLGYSGGFGSATLTIGSGAKLTTAVLSINTPAWTLNLQSGGTLNVGSISNSQSSNGLNWTGGTLAVTGASGLSVGPGGSLSNITLSTNHTLNVTNTLTVEPSGLFTMAGGQLNVGGLAVVGTGQFDLANSHLIINYGSNPDPISSIAALVASGYANGAWNGPGVNSSTAQSTPGYGLGYADSADPGNPASLSSGTIEIAYTLLGDADLNGIVNGVDFGILAANFNKSVSRWDQGDFNYDNIVNGIDFADLAANFNKGASGADVGPSALSDPAIVAFAEANGLMADVPEPAAAGILVAPTVALFTKRRRKLPRLTPSV